VTIKGIKNSGAIGHFINRQEVVSMLHCIFLTFFRSENVPTLFARINRFDLPKLLANVSTIHQAQPAGNPDFFLDLLNHYTSGVADGINYPARATDGG
jgi:hypothetical protein